MKAIKVASVCAFAVVVLVVSFFSALDREARDIINGLRMGRVAIDPAAIKMVDEAIEKGGGGWALANDPAYLDIVATLNRMTKEFPVTAKWTYIVAPKLRNGDAILSVLTIEPNKDESTTLPGVSYDIGPYPAMGKIIESDREFVVSWIVWDQVYKIWTRSGFAKIYNTDGTVSGILSVDIDASSIFSMIFDSVATTVMVIAGAVVMYGVVQLLQSKRDMEGAKK